MNSNVSISIQFCRGVIQPSTLLTNKTQGNDKIDHQINLTRNDKFQNTENNRVLNITDRSQVLNKGLYCTMHLHGDAFCENYGYGSTINVYDNAIITNRADDCKIILSDQAKLFNFGNNCNILYYNTAMIENSGLNCTLCENRFGLQTQTDCFSNDASKSTCNTTKVNNVFNAGNAFTASEQKKVLRKVIANFKCPICHEHQTSGYIGSCGHLICEQCYDKWSASIQEKNLGPVTCPFCRCVM